MSLAQQKKQNIVISKLMKGTFDTELGRKLLDHLEKVFVDRHIYQPNQSHEETAYRQGQADVIKQIRRELDGR